MVNLLWSGGGKSKVSSTGHALLILIVLLPTNFVKVVVDLTLPKSVTKSNYKPTKNKYVLMVRIGRT
jgi:hypothetical protein